MRLARSSSRQTSSMVWPMPVGREVPDNSAHVVGDEVERKAGEHRHSARPVIVGGLVGFDDDVVALADGEEQRRGLVRYDGHKVHCYHGHFMLVDGETEHDFGR